LQLIEVTEKLHTDKYKEIMNYWKNDDSCMFTSLPIQDLENFKRLIFVTQNVLPSANKSLLGSGA
jgi:hypothetical protein